MRRRMATWIHGIITVATITCCKIWWPRIILVVSRTMAHKATRAYRPSSYNQWKKNHRTNNFKTRIFAALSSSRSTRKLSIRIYRVKRSTSGLSRSHYKRSHLPVNSSTSKSVVTDGMNQLSNENASLRSPVSRRSSYPKSSTRRSSSVSVSSIKMGMARSMPKNWKMPWKLSVFSWRKKKY